MTTRHLASIGILTAILGTAPVTADAGPSTIRVDARIRTPIGTVRVTAPGPAVRVVRHGPRTLPRRHGHVVVRAEIARHDRRVAGRLARYTGVARRDILEMRRLGYRWLEIGAWLELPRHTIRAALRADSWRAYLRHADRRDRHRDRDEGCDRRDRDDRRGGRHRR
jgi:hypothetical protein